jgi:hypothetical protein
MGTTETRYQMEETVMRRTAFLAALSIGFVPIAFSTGAETTPERPAIPAEAEATLADCQVWLDQLSELVDVADPDADEETMEQAGEDRDRVAEYCDEGRYYEGISLAAEAIEKIEDDANDD